MPTIRDLDQTFTLKVDDAITIQREGVGEGTYFIEANMLSNGAIGPSGPDGPQGPPGPAGNASTVPGPPGPPGADGAPGPQGNASTVPGPQGPVGPAGPQGNASTVPGPQGPIGNAGATGATGPQGPQGNASTVPGPTGPAGANGAVGPQGPIGNTGATGATGPAGANGATGPSGANGAVGPAGANGVGVANAYLSNGWLTLTYSNATVANVGYVVGATGAQGPIGNTGATGPAGSNGATGPAGANGAVGPQGPIGNTGATGNGVSSLTIANTTSLKVTPSTLTSAGTFTMDLSNTGVVSGFYTAANVTVDAQGRITTIANGVAGSGGNASVTYNSVVTALGYTPVNPANAVTFSNVVTHTANVAIGTGKKLDLGNAVSIFRANDTLQLIVDPDVGSVHIGSGATVFIQGLLLGGPIQAASFRDNASGNLVVPTGGAPGLVLTKNSSSDFDSSWTAPPSGGDITGPPLPAVFFTQGTAYGISDQYFQGSGNDIMSPMGNYGSPILIHTNWGSGGSTGGSAEFEFQIICSPYSVGSGYDSYAYKGSGLIWWSSVTSPSITSQVTYDSSGGSQPPTIAASYGYDSVSSTYFPGLEFSVPGLSATNYRSVVTVKYSSIGSGYGSS